MKRLTILPDSDPLLRTISTPVEIIDDELKSFAEAMGEAMMEKRGLGLAAVQVGRPIRLIVVREPGSEVLTFMVNPKVSRPGNRLSTEVEGCLSVPQAKWKRLTRPAKCDAEWQDLDGNPHLATFSNWSARAVQHEVEHLDGILITDHPRAE